MACIAFEDWCIDAANIRTLLTIFDQTFFPGAPMNFEFAEKSVLSLDDLRGTAADSDQERSSSGSPPVNQRVVGCMSILPHGDVHAYVRGYAYTRCNASRQDVEDAA